MVLIWLTKWAFYKFFFIINFFVIYKNEREYWFNLLSKKLDGMLNKAIDYYKNNKAKLREQARDKYRNLSEEEKDKKENMGKIDFVICLKKRNKD